MMRIYRITVRIKAVIIGILLPGKYAQKKEGYPGEMEFT
jgi:hypothetical protein